MQLFQELLSPVHVTCQGTPKLQLTVATCCCTGCPRIAGEATATATVHAAKAATSAADAASAAASAAAEDSGRQQQQQEGLVQAGQVAAGAMRQVAAGTSAAVGTATAELKDTLQEGLEVAKGAVDNVAGAQAGFALKCCWPPQCNRHWAVLLAMLRCATS